MRPWVLASALTFLAHGTDAQLPGMPPPSAPAAAPSTGVVLGQTIDGTSGQPVAGALVALSAGPGGLGSIAPGDTVPLERLMSLDLNNVLAGVHQTITDNQGRFAFTGLPSGTLSITATKPGWSGGGYGQRRPDGSPTPLVLTAAEHSATIALHLWKDAAITGMVVDEADEPIVGVQVRALRRTWLSGRARYSLNGSAQTDDRGIYRISALRPGEYIAVIAQTPVTMPASGTPQGLDPAMIQAMIAAAGSGANPNTLIANISALAVGAGASGGIRAGDWVLQTSAPGSRLVPPALGSDGRMLAYRTTFHPSATASSQAADIVLGSGEERAGVDFQLRPVPVFQISGTVAGPDGPAGNLGVRLLPAGTDELTSDAGFESASTTTDAGGTFLFLAVPPGQYTLKVLRTPRPAASSAAAAMGANMSMIQNARGSTAMSMGPLTMDMMMPVPPDIPTDPTLWATVPVSVGDTDVAGLGVPLRAGFRVSGRAEFIGSAAKPTPDQLRRMPVVLDRADTGGAARISPLQGPGQAPNGQFDATGQFTSYGLVPGKYFVRVPFSFGGWTLLSASVGGRDAADMPLDVENADVSGVVLTFTDRPTELSGAVHDAQGRADAAASVVLFPVQRESWMDFGSAPRRLRVARAGPNGQYHIGGLPPGEYFAAAVRTDVAGDWQNPNFLSGLSQSATRVTVTDGEKKTLDLTSGR